MANDAHTIEAIARDAVVLARAARDMPAGLPTGPFLDASAAALTRLGELVDLQLREDVDAHALRFAARTVVQTWIFGHALLLLQHDVVDDVDACERATRELVLGPGTDLPAPDTHPSLRDIAQPSLRDIARRLDAHVYGATEPPRAFQRHLLSFYDEIDISGVEGTRLSPAAPPPPHTAARVDHVRVSLWVLLFLAHDHYAASGATEQAMAARRLFDRLREATDAFYAKRRQARAAPSD